MLSEGSDEAHPCRPVLPRRHLHLRDRQRARPLVLLDPGTLGLKRSHRWLSCVGFVAYIFRFQGNVLFLVSLVSWRCRNWRAKMGSKLTIRKAFRARITLLQFTRFPDSYSIVRRPLGSTNIKKF